MKLGTFYVADIYSSVYIFKITKLTDKVIEFINVENSDSIVIRKTLTWFYQNYIVVEEVVDNKKLPDFFDTSKILLLTNLREAIAIINNMDEYIDNINPPETPLADSFNEPVPYSTNEDGVTKVDFS